MNKSLLDIFNKILCNRLSQNAVTAVLGNQNKSVQNLIGCMDEIISDLIRKTNKNGGWNVLNKTFILTTIADTDAYDLPDDYNFLVRDTLWDKTNNRMMKQSSASMWQAIKNAIVGGLCTHWRIMNNQIVIHPVPASSGVLLMLEYISGRPWVSADGLTYKEFPTQDSDMFILDDELLCRGIVYKFKASQGLDYSEEKNSFDTRLNELLSDDAGMETFNRHDAHRRRGWNVPEGNWGQPL